MRLTIALAIMAFPGISMAMGEEPDSITVRNLDEIIVEGRTQQVVDHGVEYKPSKTVKRTSTDAASLLYAMQIPQVDIDPISSAIKILGAEKSEIYIDYVPATPQDLTGLRPEDVRAVQVLDHPADPRFGNATHVINFIMVKYEWGGYTKMTANGTTLAEDYASAKAFSKFAYKEWTFDAFAETDFRHSTRNPGSLWENFLNVDFDGRHYENIIRASINGSDYIKDTNSQAFSLRATYYSMPVYMVHTLSFGRNATPESGHSSDVNFSEPIAPTDKAHSSESSLALYPGVSGYYYFYLPKNTFLMFNWAYTYGASHQASAYCIDGMNPILNENREKTHAPSANMHFTKNLSHGNSLFVSFNSTNSFHKAKYRGSDAEVKRISNSSNSFVAGYNQSWGNGWNLHTSAGVNYGEMRADGKRTMNSWKPEFIFNIQYQINNNNSLSMSGEYKSDIGSSFFANDALIRTHELMWVQGNSEIGAVRQLNSNLSYNFIPSNKFSLYSSLIYTGYYNNVNYEYLKLPDLDGIVRRYANLTDLHQFEWIISATLKPFGDKLSIKNMTDLCSIALISTPRMSHTSFFSNFKVIYSIDQWSVSLFYNYSTTHLSSDGGYWTYPNSYGLTAGYSIGNLQLTLNLNNWFRKNGFFEEIYESRVYSYDNKSWRTGGSRNLNFTLTYTFPYGKVVDAMNEIYGVNKTGSSIIH